MVASCIVLKGLGCIFGAILSMNITKENRRELHFFSPRLNVNFLNTGILKKIGRVQFLPDFQNEHTICTP